MNWLTKQLALDLLAITIDGLNRVFKAIEASPDPVNGDWPPASQQQQQPAAAEQPQQQAAPAPATAPDPEPQPQQQAAPEPQPQQPATTPDTAETLHTQAQETLRAIALAEGPTWITDTLFPKYGVTSLNDIGPEQLPSLITEATKHQQEKTTQP